jgi:hypothetical protein
MRQHHWFSNFLAAPLLLALAAPTTLPAQDFEGIVTARARAMPGGGEMKIYLKENKSRVELTAPGQGQVAIITDPAKGETYMVMPAQSMYMVLKLSDAERMADSMIRQHEPGADVSMTSMGKHETIAGHSCEVYRFRGTNSATDICFASDIGAFRAGVGLFSGPPIPGQHRPVPPWAQALLKKGVFPLRVSDTTGVMLWEATSVEPKHLDAALFVPPAEYRRMEMPGFGRPPGN